MLLHAVDPSARYSLPCCLCPPLKERERELSVAGLVLAAGGGRRYGGPKALVHHEGQLLVERAVSTVREAGCAPIVVVLGAAAAEVRAQAKLGDVTIVE